MKHRITALILIFILAFALAVPAAASGPVDVLTSDPQYILIGVIIGVVLAFIICFALKSQLKNVRKGTTAENYISSSLNLTSKSDRFTHRTTVRTKIQKK